MTTKTSGTEIAISILMLPVIAVFYAFVATYLWEWFLVPLGVPSVGMAHIYGVMMTLGMIMPNESNGSSNKGALLANVLGKAFGALLIWGLGAMVHGWMI